jgi:plasmid stabilization system protein ParE
MSGFALHPEAYDDIDEIRAYIAENNPDAADRMVNEVFERIRLLTQFPNQGFRRPNFTSLPMRFVPVREYLIAYAPDKSPLWVVAVMRTPESPRDCCHPQRSRAVLNTARFALSQIIIGLLIPRTRKPKRY